MVLRQVVRYLATVPPVARDLVDKEGFSLIAKQVRTPVTTTRITSLSPPPPPAFPSPNTAEHPQPQPSHVHGHGHTATTTSSTNAVATRPLTRCVSCADMACFRQGVGGDSDWARVSEICERLGLLEDGGVREVRTTPLS